MKANELMIGDWVYAFGCKNVQVKEILEDGIHDFTTYSLSPFDEIEPILLTPEILERNGWRYDELNGEFYGAVTILGNKAPFLVLNGSVQVNYVHELQHALRICGIEKEIVL